MSLKAASRSGRLISSVNPNELLGSDLESAHVNIEEVRKELIHMLGRDARVSLPQLVAQRLRCDKTPTREFQGAW